MSRRRGSATALKASEVVEARGMNSIYSHMGICQELFLGQAGSGCAIHVGNRSGFRNPLSGPAGRPIEIVDGRGRNEIRNLDAYGEVYRFGVVCRLGVRGFWAG